MNPYRRLLAALTPHYDAREARQIALLVLEDAFGVGRTAALVGEFRDFPEHGQRRLGEIAARLASGEPVQYVLGRAAFCGLELEVTPATLIPRPETEELAARAAALAPRRALDAGTGSGCIALALKHACPGCTVEGWDLSAEALDVARRNAARLGLDVRFRRRDLLEAAENAGFTGPYGAPEGGLDLLVSNPPYVRLSERAAMAAHVVGHEPAMALFVPDDDALRFYRALARLGLALLARGGTLLVEANTALAAETASLFAAAGYADSTVLSDFTGRPRFVSAVRA